MKIQVSEIIVKYMERLGIEYIFGMPGAHILPVYDSLYKSGIKSILAKHEQGAAFMAGGNARASGKISACISTAGPGATNLITGVANAYADKQPVLVITGETSTHIFGKGGLQESSGEGGSIDQYELFKSITRYHRVVERTDYLANVLNQASKVLLSPDPGPVLLSLPFNIQKERVDDSILDGILTKKHNHTTIPDNSTDIEIFTSLLMAAENPVIIAGYGCIKSGAQQQLTELSKLMHIPVTTSLKGKGAISEHSDYSLGSLGVTSYSDAYTFITEKADLIVVLGASFNERTSYVWDKMLINNRKIAQVDSNYEQLEKVFKADIAIQGDIKQVLGSVLEKIKKSDIKTNVSNNVLNNLSAVNEGENGPALAVLESNFPLVRKFFSALEEHFPEDAMIFDDNIIFAQNFFRVSNGIRYFPNSGISSLGHAIPAAIGARFSENKPTFAILGDGGFQMCCMELMTAVNYNIPLTVVLFNNSTMGLIRKNQSQQYEKRFLNCDFKNPDYELLARSFGITHTRVDKEADIEHVFSSVDFTHAINLIEIMIDKDSFPNYTTKR